MTQKRFAIIGAGPMGLMAAVKLLDQGHSVTIYERDDRIGGMSANFDFDGLSIERYYHFICKTDYPLFALLERYGLSKALRWTDTKMGYFYKGKLYKWGNPFALLAFPHLGPISKFRYALHVMYTKGIKDWTALDKEEAGAWIRRWVGQKAYDVMWKDAFRLKFFEFKDNLSASWIGTRIKRVALSRRNLMNESMGYLEGGSMTLLERMVQDIQARGGRIELSQGIDEVVSENGKVTGVSVGGEFTAYDGVISTAPIQYVPALVPGLPEDFRAKVAAVQNIPVACVILKLKHAVSENFWMNISDPGIEIPGVIEYSNLNPGHDPGQKILYAPYYMPKTHPKWQQSNAELIEEVLGYLARINPAFKRDWVLASHCHRYEFAQTICPPGFQDMLPSMRTPVQGFFMADTAYYYPEDRSINESINTAEALVNEALRA
ncbi:MULTISPECIES: NAD(P)/FAD-dependent oxidoreductase [Stenotrophomonas]|uniref:FAD-dependent oxidoreductase n=1 Tax=Stenotrophomonas maltophilia TaxID=40324 RepID=A0AAD0BLL6_STEMA|nr:NAD(P)/FAD-dependent oxidoreductase [Stenotrophomonas maltophilia]AUI06149.1 FAD-dependent oxidoreductase [Stenotrophomonas maltophilia]EKU9976433.1 NAD(P)/FAD-dependent oxidoreductase [Stenotrophomonas maltophilia]MBH1680648.1 NAD(P)/FAD-dependent oxidoreductase [Stenotrophomonas maltophilia]MBH1874782.1 NAD(P)/FAD-dependent oxidoreductase [Stenotrophomonas maltophilia]HDS1827135.1 NAD(P)/FAD-dependent oxidoreductase [Stenotrophomonas maltophilia]